MGGPQCNKEVLAKLANNGNPDNNETNPMWKALKRFKDLN
jgi:hypothetical protein